MACLETERAESLLVEVQKKIWSLDVLKISVNDITKNKIDKIEISFVWLGHCTQSPVVNVFYHNEFIYSSHWVGCYISPQGVGHITYTAHNTYIHTHTAQNEWAVNRVLLILAYISLTHQLSMCSDQYFTEKKYKFVGKILFEEFDHSSVVWRNTGNIALIWTMSISE